MTNHVPAAPAATLTILDNEIRCVDGLYSLNDLHKAAGGEDKHRPTFFLRNAQTQALIAAVDAENANENKRVANLQPALDSENTSENNRSANLQSATRVINGDGGGTYVCKELVVAYAAWISPEFHLAVLRVFLHHVDNENQDYALLAERVAELEDLVHNQMINPSACIIKAPLKNRARLTSRFPMTETSATTFISGSPRPSAIADFLRLLLLQTLANNGGARAPNTTPSGNKRRRLMTVVEARHSIFCGETNTKS